MGKKILLGVIGVALGFVIGSIVMTGLHLANHLIYPPPADVEFMSQDPENMERMNAWIQDLPTGALLLVVLIHGLGAMSGAFIAMFVTGRRSMTPAIVVGVFFTLAAVVNLMSVSHPSWFPFADLPIYLALSFLAGKLVLRPAAP